jgi:hypothetical protein
MKKLVIVAIFLLTVISVTSGVVTGGGMPPAPPLPDNLKIVPPDPSIGVIAGCSGIWDGIWSETTITTIIVSEIDPNKVSGFYSWSGNFNDSGYTPISGTVTPEGTLSFLWGDAKGSGRRELTLVPVIENGIVVALNAKYKKGAGWVYRAKLKKR